MLREDTFRNTVVTIVVSMSTPWYLLEELEYWMKILKKYIQNLALTEDELKELKCKSKKYSLCNVYYYYLSFDLF